MNDWHELYKLGEAEVAQGPVSNLTRRFVEGYRIGCSEGLKLGLREAMAGCLGERPTDVRQRIDALTTHQIEELVNQALKARTFERPE